MESKPKRYQLIDASKMYSSYYSLTDHCSFCSDFVILVRLSEMSPNTFYTDTKHVRFNSFRKSRHASYKISYEKGRKSALLAMKSLHFRRMYKLLRIAGKYKTLAHHHSKDKVEFCFRCPHCGKFNHREEFKLILKHFDEQDSI